MGAITTQMDDTLECCESESPALGLRFLERRFGDLSLQEQAFTHSGAGAPQAKDFAASVTEEELTEELQPMPTSPASRQRPLSV